MSTGIKGVTITMKIELDLRGLPPEKVATADLANLERWAQDLKQEMEEDFQEDPDQASRTRVSVEVEEHPEDGVILIEEPIHHFFGLTYSSYLVLPRSLLQSAPVPWQRRFVAMVNELEKMFPEHHGHGYWVRRKKGNRFVEDPLRNYRHVKLTPVTQKIEEKT